MEITDRGPDELPSFRFEITRERFMHPLMGTMGRLRQHLDDSLASWQCRWEAEPDVYVLEGQGPPSAVAGIQAMAMGHDIDAVLDLHGVPAGRPIATTIRWDQSSS